MDISREDRLHVERVVAEMEDISAAIEALMERIGDRRSISPEAIQSLRYDLTTLKNRLERGAKYGTVDGTKRELSPWELAYFQPAVTKAKAFLGIRSNSHPIDAGWMGKLMGARSDIGMPLANLKGELGISE